MIIRECTTLNTFVYRKALLFCIVSLAASLLKQDVQSSSLSLKVCVHRSESLRPISSSKHSHGERKNKEKLTRLYTQAISEFIKTAYKKDKTTFDTLFFGKHVYGQSDDFPDIVLPELIENTHIRLVSPDDGLAMQRERKTLVYVNMMGWIDKQTAEFIFVVFSHGAQHQYDYFINYTYSLKKKQYEIHSIFFEDYSNTKDSARQRISVYKNGRYVDAR